MNDRTTFRDRLVAVESLSPKSRETLQQELRNMFIRELRLPGRIIFGAVATFCLATAALCGFLAVTQTDLPPLARIGLGTGTLFGLAGTAILTRVLRRGSIDLKVDNRLMAAMMWVFTVLMMVLFLMLGMSIEDRLLGVMMIAYGLTFLVGAGVCFLAFRIQQAELAMHEKFLEIELRLAELCEKQ
jgi:hypothetical protein